MKTGDEALKSADEETLSTPDSASDVFGLLDPFGDIKAARILAGVAAMRGSDCVRELVRILS